MSSNFLTVLGTASRMPTRSRAHNGYFLSLNDTRVLFDPGEGTQRQMTLAGKSVASLHAVCISHFHGDHCLGLPGIIQRRSADNNSNKTSEELPVCYPTEGQRHFESLRFASVYTEAAHLIPTPLDPTEQVVVGDVKITALRLDHRTETLGYRVEAPMRFNFDVSELEKRGVQGADRSRLLANGSIATNDGTVKLEDVGSSSPGKVFAFIMDTAICDNAIELARDADLVLTESTYAESESALAAEYKHLTASQAATIARQANAKRLVLSHFSERYTDVSLLEAEAKEIFDNVEAASDLDTFEF